MTNPFLLVLRDAQHAPVSVCLLVCTLLLHVMDQFGSVHAKSWAYSFADVVLKKQYYRMLTYSLFHRNAVHLYLTLTSLWSCRQLEIKYGSVFYFNYTVLLLLSDSLMTTCLLRYLAAFGDPDSATAFISALRGRLQTFEMVCMYLLFRNPGSHTHTYSSYALTRPLVRLQVGFTNVLLCWLSYESVRNTDASSSFYLFGVLPVYWGLAPIVFMLAVPLVCNRTSRYASRLSVLNSANPTCLSACCSLVLIFYLPASSPQQLQQPELDRERIPVGHGHAAGHSGGRRLLECLRPRGHRPLHGRAVR